MMPHGPIAEMIRTRVISGDHLEDDDIVVCYAADEAELLAQRPELNACRRHATRHLQPGLVLFLPADGAPSVGFSPALRAIAENRHMGGN